MSRKSQSKAQDVVVVSEDENAMQVDVENQSDVQSDVQSDDEQERKAPVKKPKAKKVVKSAEEKGSRSMAYWKAKSFIENYTTMADTAAFSWKCSEYVFARIINAMPQLQELADKMIALGKRVKASKLVAAAINAIVIDATKKASTMTSDGRKSAVASLRLDLDKRHLKPIVAAVANAEAEKLAKREAARLANEAKQAAAAAPAHAPAPAQDAIVEMMRQQMEEMKAANLLQMQQMMAMFAAAGAKPAGAALAAVPEPEPLPEPGVAATNDDADADAEEKPVSPIAVGKGKLKKASK